MHLLQCFCLDCDIFPDPLRLKWGKAIVELELVLAIALLFRGFPFLGLVSLLLYHRPIRMIQKRLQVSLQVQVFHFHSPV